MTKINWAEHVAAYRGSSQSVAAYCAEAGIKPETFRYHLYKSKTKTMRRRRSQQFLGFQVANELVIERDTRGGLTLAGFDVTHLPQIVGAWLLHSLETGTRTPLVALGSSCLQGSLRPSFRAPPGGTEELLQGVNKLRAHDPQPLVDL
jgi:hypothetical protein